MTDVTENLQIVGRNADGSFTVRLVPNNAGEVALSVPNQAAGGFPVRINGTVVNFASQADYQNAINAISPSAGGGGMPELNTRQMGGGGGSGSARSFIRTASDGAEVVNSLMDARNSKQRKEEYQELQDAIKDARAKLAAQNGTYPGLVGPMLDLFDATNDAITITISNLEDDVTTAYVQAGIGAGRTISDLMPRRGGYGNGGGGDGVSTLAVGGLVLGGGILLGEALGRGGRRRRH